MTIAGSIIKINIRLRKICVIFGKFWFDVIGETTITNNSERRRKKMKGNHSYKKAFTIVELIIVIAVIGILAAILIPTFSNMIARANAKAALADARSTLTSYLSENLSIIDGEIAASIVIFVYKAKAYYVFGYSNTGPDMGKLMQSGGNPYHYDDLAALIEDYNCTDDSIIGTPEEEQYAFYLRTEPSGTGTVKGVKSNKSMDDINNTYVNITDKVGDVPDTSEVFDGFLIGMIVDANQINPGGSGTHPGDNPGGGEKPKLIVTFDPGVDDGSVTGMPDPLQIEVEKNVPFELPAAPTREGYDFAGWSAPEIGGVVGPTQFVSVSSSCTITATWEEKVEITITFDPAGGTFEPAEGYSFTGNTIKVFTSDNLTNLILYSRATRANKNFLGWLDEESNTLYNDSYTGSIHLEKNTTLKAQWDDILYSLTYDLNGGTGMGTNGGSYPIGTKIVLTQAPTLEGKIFGGWKWEGFTYDKDGTFTMPGYDVTLVAQWLDSYTVTYNAGEGTGTPPTQEPVLPDTEITIKPATGLSRTVDGEEWVFAGWVCNVDGQTHQPGEEYTVVANTTFTADFVPPVYYVTYEGENAPTDTKGYAEGETVTVLNVTAPRDGYTFLGWYAAQNGQMYQPDDTFKMPKGGITLEAQWSKLSKLTLIIEGSDENGMTLVHDPSKIINGDTFVTEYENVPQGTNIYNYLFGTALSYEDDLYFFRGWVNAADSAQTYSEDYVGPISMPGQDATFIVVWEGNPFELTFNLNGGSGTFNTIEFFPGQNITLPSTEPTISGNQVFMGWERSDMVGGSLLAAGGTIINAPAYNLELKAIWANPEFYIVYDLNGGTGGPNPANVTVPWTPTGTYTISTAVPSKTGHSFLNWGSTLGGTIAAGGTIDMSQVTPGSTITLTANWQPYIWNVFYNANGGTGTVTDSTGYPHDSQVTVKPNGFTYAGHEFVSWNTAADGSGTTYMPGDTFTITAHTTLYAQWEELQAQEYTITFTLQDAFNGQSAGTVEVKKTMSVGDSFTINNANFTEYFPGYKPYDTTNKFNSTYSKTITAGESTSINGGSVNVYGYVMVGGDEYIKITTKAGFERIDDDATHLSKKYQLQNNITTAVTKCGTDSNKFAGVFDGNGFYIQFAFSNTSTNYVGLFAWIDFGATVKNLEVRFGTINGFRYVGGMVGRNDGTVSNCKATGTTVRGNYSASGDDYDTYLGGFAGANIGTIEHSSCSTNVTNVNGNDTVGGFVGINTGAQGGPGKILNCSSNGSVDANMSYAYGVGGFVGQNLSGATISWSSAAGAAVKGLRNVGGFAGYNTATIEYSYTEIRDILTARTGYYSTSGAYVAGLVGNNVGGTIRNCYARINQIQAGEYVAGISVGNGGSVSNCYFNFDTTLNTYRNLDIVLWSYTSAQSASSLYYIYSSNQNLSYATWANSDSDLKTKVNANSNWTNAGCWDTSGTYVKLKKWGDVYGSATVNFVSNLAGVANPAPQTSTGGSPITMPNLTDPTGNKLLAGWATSPSATSATYMPNQSYAFSGEVTLYGVWKDKVTITFVANLTGVSDPAAQTVASGTSVTMPTLTGSQYFMGWSTSQSATTPTYSPGQSVSFTSNTTLYGVWTSESGITFSAGSATGATDIPNNVTGVGTLTIPNIIPKYIPADASMTVATAYSFNHWQDSQGNKYYPGGTINVTGGLVTLTANWTTGCYAIRTVADFQTMGNTSVNNKKYVLAGNLSLTGVTNNIGGETTGGTAFQGVFNGNGYTLSNLSYTASQNYAGLFGCVTNNADIKYLNINNFTMRVSSIYSYTYCGVLAGGVDGGTFRNIVITNSTASGALINNTFIALIDGSAAKFYNCWANGTQVY